MRFATLIGGTGSAGGNENATICEAIYEALGVNPRETYRDKTR